MSGTVKLLLIIWLIWIGIRIINGNFNTQQPSEPISTEELRDKIEKFREDSELLLDNNLD